MFILQIYRVKTYKEKKKQNEKNYRLFLTKINRRSNVVFRFELKLINIKIDIVREKIKKEEIHKHDII